MKNKIKLAVGAIRRMGREMLYLGWTLAGTGLVLITLSSTTLKQGIYISLAGFTLHLVGTVIDYIYDARDDEDEQ